MGCFAHFYCLFRDLSHRLARPERETHLTQSQKYCRGRAAYIAARLSVPSMTAVLHLEFLVLG